MSNPIDISAQINGLIPYQKYNYFFNGIGSNWPTIVNPLSGTFTATSSSGRIDATVYFCLSRTGCLDSDGLLPYNDCLCNVGDNPFSKIQLSFYSVDDSTNIYKSDAIRLVCSGCFPVLKIEIPNTGIIKEKEHKIDINLENLTPNKLYNYSIEPLSSDWPFSLSSTSGQIFAHDKTEKLTLYGGFCATTGSCPNGQIGVIPYSIKNNAGTKNWYKTETSFRLLLTDPDFSTIIYRSNIVNIRCLDCTSTGGHVGVGVTITEGSSC
jgi:hypothetical protein